MPTKKKNQIGKIIAIVVVVIIIAITAYFLFSPSTQAGEVPSYIKGDIRLMYEWSKTPIGNDLLEQVPCYCGCKYEGHLHARHCFWRDNGKFDKHGITCSVCLDIAKKTKQMYEEGKNICEIRKEIDSFYAPNVHLGTETPMPAGCV